MNGTVINIMEMLPPYKGEERLVKYRQNTVDIIDEILRKHAECARDYNKIAVHFWKGNAEATAQYLFNFMKQHVIYGVEPGKFQSSKTPAAILHEGKKYGGDCKHYALFIVGVAEALRRQGYPINAYYRFASYNDSKTPGHVFAIIVDPGTGAEYWTDPVLKTFNQRTPLYRFAINKKPQLMNNTVGELYSISGITREETANGTMYTAVPAMHYSDFLYGRVGMPTAEYNVTVGKINLKSFIKKFGAAAPRNAFLALLKINFAGLAVKFNAAYKKQPARIITFWRKVGGNGAKLMTAIHQGVKWYNKVHHKNVKLSGPDESMNGPWIMPRTEYANGNFSSNIMMAGISNYDFLSGVEDPNISDAMAEADEVSGIRNDRMISGQEYEMMGFKFDQMRNMDSVGFAPAAVPALLAAAAPIMVAAKKLLKSFGMDVDTKSTEKADKDVVDTHNTAADGSEEGAKEGADVTTTEDGGVDHGAGVKTKVKKGADGGEEMEIDATEDGAPVKGSKKGKKGGDDDESGGDSFFDKAKTWISDHKAIAIGVPLGLITIPVIIHMASGGGKKKHR